MSDVLPAESLDRLFRAARSYNGFLDKPVTTEQLHAIWDLMKWGATSANQMPARILWLVSPEQKAKLAALSSGTNGEKIVKAPVTAILGMDLEFYEQAHKLFPHADVRSWFAGNDASIHATAFRNSTLQGAYLILAARALGLDTGPMSGFDNAAVDEAFFAGTSIKSNFLCMLGYGDPATIFDRLPRPAFEEFNTIL
jgi:3-hydroxypropanoate dehydrogenase